MTAIHLKLPIGFTVFIILATLSACGADSSKESDGRVVADASTTHPNETTGSADHDFLATELLARPTDTSIAISAVPSYAVEIYFEYGTTDAYGEESRPIEYPAQTPITATIDGLTPDQGYVYRMRWRAPGSKTFFAGEQHRFHTARPAGRSFIFTIQADSHLDDKSDLELYHRALENQLADEPDFMIDLGDNFMCEKYSAPFAATTQTSRDEPTVISRYLYERGNYGLIAHSTPLFLVNGNHEGELGWLREGTENTIAVWASLARQAYYPPPLPDGFYTGSPIEEPLVGQRGSWYAWQWGDALFIVLDPFWYTLNKPKQDGWVWTLGKEQYDWLTQTLQNSTSIFRFVFIHNLLGGLDSQARGGAEVAKSYEWGGNDADGKDVFEIKRPGWGKPIHRLLEENRVTAVFHGHDHLYAKQELGAIVYQEVPQPSAPNFENGATLADEGHYTSGIILSSSGHLRVTVNTDSTTVEYVRAFREQDETKERRNGQVSDAYTLAPR